ncbi:MAG TPA: response regulator [Blastocatellia bacterium]|nr:response regulator [Blastocatellia bacterium]
MRDDGTKKILYEVARGSSLDRTLGLIADQVAADLGAPTCKVWVVKRGDICERCPLAEICNNRAMCMHLVSASGALVDKEYPRIPLSVFNASVMARGGTSTFDEPAGVSEKLFGVQHAAHDSGADSYAWYPLRGASGIVGLIGAYNQRRIEKTELQTLSKLAPLAVTAIRVAELQSRCDSLRHRLTQGAAVRAAAEDAARKREAELESSLADLTNQFAGIQEERDALIRARQLAEGRSEQESAQLKTELDDSRAGLASTRRSLAKLEEANTALREHNRAISESADELERSLVIAEDARARQEKARSGLAAKVSEQADTLDRVRRESGRVAGENEQLVAEVERLTRAIGQLESSVGPLSLENEHLRALNRELTESLGRAEARATETEAKNDALTAANAELEQAVGKFETLTARLEDSAGKLGDRVLAGERVRAELEHRARTLAEENRRLSAEGLSRARFLANISHELRTPMNAIIGFTSLLYEDRSLQLSDRHRRSLERVSRNARDLLELINNVLDLSKIEAGRMDVFSEPVDVGDLVERALAVVEPLKDGRAITLETDVEAGLPAMRTDRTKLQQILINLLSNAIKFTTQGQVKVAAARAGDRIRIAVSDTGVGIAEQDIPKIFQEFHQVGAGRGSRAGTGLGLAITSRLIGLLSGEITVSSRPGEGSVFAVTLPVAIEGRAAAALDAEVSPADPEKTALVIDADPASMFLTKKYLTDAGYSVAATDNVSRGIDIAKMARPALVAVDLDTIEDGIGLLAGFVPAAKLVIASSSDASAEQRAMSAGAHVFLRKPVDRELLLKALERAAGAAAGSVLVVDDDPDTLDLVQAMIEGTYETRIATTGREALDEIERARPDAIVLDLMLPEMDGFEVVQRLSLNPEWREIPVILLTARDLSYEERRALDIGTARVLQKGSVSRDELLAEIGLVMAERLNGSLTPKRGAGNQS